jgi:hypothetical protein
MFVLRFAIVVVLVAMTACAPWNQRPEVDPDTLRSIVAEADEMLSRTRIAQPFRDYQDFREDEWPRSIATIAPQKVYAIRKGRVFDRYNIDGLYIVTGRFFVAEWGFFVPADQSEFSPTPAEPAFELVGDGVYWYKIMG